MRFSLLGLLLISSFVVAQQPASCKQPLSGELHVFPFESKVFGNTRMLRVWLPPGYGDAANNARRYPVLYMFDGQSLFQACVSKEHPHSWSAEEIVSRLIAESKIAPMVLVGIDNAGQQRNREYLPWPDVVQGSGMSAPEGSRMPEFVLGEVMPVITAKYRVATDAENVGLGGSSYGAVAAVFIVLQAPARFGKLLAESTVAWAGNGQLVRDSAYLALAPQRAWFGVGGKEAHYPGLHLTDSLEAMGRQLADNFRKASVRDSQVQFTVDPEGGHNEDSWAKRFPDALLFLFGNTSPPAAH